MVKEKNTAQTIKTMAKENNKNATINGSWEMATAMLTVMAKGNGDGDGDGNGDSNGSIDTKTK